MGKVLFLGVNIKMKEKINDYDIDLLKNGLNDLNIKINDMQLLNAINYIYILKKWNKVYNLTSLNNVSDIIRDHLLDAFMIIPYIEDYNLILDIGSGMGIPGIILAIYFPNKQLILVDINKKKSAFLQQVVIELKLYNVKIINNTIEQHLYQEKYNKQTIAISRAFTKANSFINLFLNTNIKDLMLMKSIKIDEEVKDINLYKYNIITLNNKFNKTRYLLKITLN